MQNWIWIWHIYIYIYLLHPLLYNIIDTFQFTYVLTSTISGLLSSACATTMRRKTCTPGSGLRVMTTFHGFYSNMFAATNMFVRDNYLCFSGSKESRLGHSPTHHLWKIRNQKGSFSKPKMIPCVQALIIAWLETSKYIPQKSWDLLLHNDQP